ncbi:metallophosphoesterase [Nonomuraea diastatica]|uniref:Metallophosphoesterase n=1 Tax=Nonomuraea diastatica TaxID=1848329 RepID=A0A4R4WV03_9ACTN|nr:metallophosphoesterase [Nonomuraea diastatica]TDD21500.1 metallophosphoesterase [Nonomuraea diastatica]
MSIPSWVWGQSVMWALAHIYLWARLVRGTTPSRSRARRVGTVLAVVLAAFIPASLITPFFVDIAVSRWIAWPSNIWYGLAVYLLILLILTEPVRLAAAFIGKRRAKARAETPDSARRAFLARSIAVTAGAAATGIVGYGMATALSPPRLDRVTVRLRRGGPLAAGLRIALVGDIHLGPMLGRAHTQRIVDMINGTGADLVAIVGDLVDGTVEQLASAAAPLRGLRSRHGTFFVTGNHEYLSGATEWIEELRELGIRPLQNERVELPALDLAGVNDVTGARQDDGPDYERALGDRDPACPVILLAHQPIQVNEAMRHGVDLQLSGHTHGGQMMPLNLLTSWAQPTLAGYERFGDTQLYVTKGAGFWGPPVRVGAPPDITIVELAI